MFVCLERMDLHTRSTVETMESAHTMRVQCPRWLDPTRDRRRRSFDPIPCMYTKTMQLCFSIHMNRPRTFALMRLAQACHEHSTACSISRLGIRLGPFRLALHTVADARPHRCPGSLGGCLATATAHQPDIISQKQDHRAQDRITTSLRVIVHADQKHSTTASSTPATPS